MKNRPLEIQLIEDNPADVELTKTALSSREIGFNLQVATAGEDALRLLSRTAPFEQAMKPDLILLDLNLPGIDGREALLIPRSESVEK